MIIYLEKHTNIFDKIKTGEVKKLKSLNKKISLEELEAYKILKAKYIRTFL
jgi:hypothetical protein